MSFSYEIDAMQLMPESEIVVDNFSYATDCGASGQKWQVRKLNLDLRPSYKHV